MESIQSQSANGSPVPGKPTEVLGSDKPSRSVVGVIDQSLVALIDHVLDAESAVRENTAQVKMVESQLAQVREIPKKTEAVEKQVAMAAERVEECVEAFNRLWERVDAFEKSAVSKLIERIDGLERAMRQVAEKPAVWGAEMSDLRMELRRHTELFERPQVKTVYHRHYLTWYGWIIVGFFVVSCGMFWLWNASSQDARLKSSNDLKWRGAWEVQDTAFHHVLILLERDYNSDPEQFRKTVAAYVAHDDSVKERSNEADLKQEEADRRKQEADQAKQELEELKKERRKR